MRTKHQVHCLSGHDNTVGAILTKGVDPQVSVDVLFVCFSIISLENVSRHDLLLILLFLLLHHHHHHYNRLSPVATTPQSNYGTWPRANA